jgi:hypothetical protein
MDPAQLEDPRLGARWHLVGTGVGMLGPVCQPAQSFVGIAAQPRVHGLSADAIAAGHLGHARGALQDLEHGLKSLFHEPQLHQHDGDLLG